MGASKFPSAYDGYKEAYVFDGKQLYPVTLYGIARNWEADCRSGKAVQCQRLGDALFEGQGDLKVEPRAAMGFWLMACDRGHAPGCSKAAQAIEAGTTNYPANPVLALQTAEKGCLLKDTTSCASAALHYYRGDVAQQDRARALQLWDTGCGAKDEEACRMKAGALYYDSGEDAARAQAVELYRAGCDRKQGWGCSGYADALASGVGVARDDKAAFAAGRTGCLEAKGDTVLACAVYARFLGNSDEPEDVKRASNLLTRACLAKIAEACNDAGLLAERDPPGSGFAEWEVALSFRDGCDLSHAASCANLARLYFEGGDRIKVNLKRAVALYDKACALGDRPACNQIEQMGSMATNARNAKPAVDPAAPSDVQLARAVELAKVGRGNDAFEAVARLMEEADADAEWLLGGWFYYGYAGVVDTPDKRNGLILMENAARQGHIEALKWVGMAYWEGDGVSVDQDKALGYMGYAAGRGDEMAEAIWRSMKLEPVRQENARRAREMAEAAERRKNDFWANFSAAAAAWATSSSNYASSYSSSSSSSWQSLSNIQAQHNWNNYINYMQGYTTACVSSNPYC
ncbi:SEL1-like repeat protein [Erythrobacter sp. SG61-1L]|uniref:tetratricopeptide repeat protein n=1 Tax=Erythrobacter sp. SG61-1L TaxID=1603897 RepID=UPI00138F5F34|nr:SEL1-like repeat protein [Erythrobacter sp. SG61-1L]